MDVAYCYTRRTLRGLCVGHTVEPETTETNSSVHWRYLANTIERSVQRVLSLENRGSMCVYT